MLRQRDTVHLRRNSDCEGMFVFRDSFSFGRLPLMVYWSNASNGLLVDCL